MFYNSLTLSCLIIKKIIQIKSGKLAYFVFNEDATETIICFHGFGQKAQEYEWLANEHLEYRVISINLFFHGNSVLPATKLLTPLDWKLYFDQLIKIEDIQQFSLTGYSMGGRFALTTLNLYPQSVKAIYLVAADGIVASKLFKVATGTVLMRAIFKWMLNSYPVFLKIATTLTKLGILSKGLQKFAQLYMQDKKERDRIYNSWTTFRQLQLSPQELASISEKHKIPVHIALGKFDRMIPVSRIKPHLINNPYLHYKTVEISHHKLFYYNFLKLVSLE